MAALGGRVAASDGAERMIENARARSVEYADQIEFSVIDVTDTNALMSLGERRFDAAVCTMALFDIADIDPLVKSLSRLLKVERFVFTVLHPCFNSIPDLQMVAEKDFDDLREIPPCAGGAHAIARAGWTRSRGSGWEICAHLIKEMDNKSCTAERSLKLTPRSKSHYTRSTA